MTTAAAVIFMLTSLSLAYLAQDRTGSSLFEEEAPAAAEEGAFGEAPAAPAEAAGGFEEVPAPPAAEPAAPEAPAPAPEAQP
jgi:hypothetical protein